MNLSIKRLCRQVPALFLLCLGPCIAQAGTFSYTPGTWGTFTGTGAGTPTAYSSDASANSITPSLTLTSPSSGDSFTLGATYSFQIVWTPAAGDTPPANVVVTFHRQGTMIVGSDGVSSILNGATQLLEMDSTNNFLSGASSNLTDVNYTFPLVLQTDGTYLATGSFTTDTLSTTFNTLSGPITSAQETFTLYDMEPSV